MFQVLLGKWIAKKGGATALLIVGDLITKVTKSKEDDKMWAEVKKVLKKFG